MTMVVRTLGGLIAVVAIALVRLLHGSIPPRYPTVPLPLVVVLGLAGLLVVARAAAARAAAVVGGLAALQVAGYALVASRDWYNFAGAGGASYGDAAVGSQQAFTVAAAALAAVVLCLLAYRLAPVSAAVAGPPGLKAAWVVLAGGIVAALPILLGAWSGAAISTVGQFTMLWSIPWGLGIAAAGALDTRAARRAAAGGVAGSVLLTTVTIAALG